jgi:hypothetical protein
MKTLDLNKPVTANQLNENMFKKFGVKVNFDKYTREELENYRNLLRTKIFQVEQTRGFNSNLTDDTYHKDKAMVNLLNTRIKEMLGEAKLPMKTVNGKKVPAFAADGKGKNDITKKKNTKVKEELKGKQTKLDQNHNGKLDADDFKKLRAKKKVKEGIEHVAELAHHHAAEYAKHHRMGNLEQCGHHKKACEECGGMISHGPMGECYHKHAGIMGGMPYGIKEGGMAPAAPMGGQMGGAPAPAVGGMESQGMGTPEQGVAHNPVLGGQTVGENMKQGDTKRSSTGGTITKTATGLKHTSGKNYSAMNPPPEDKKLEKKKSKVKENQHKVQIARLQYLREDEEEKAKTITAGSDMVNDFTTWMTRVGQYQTKSMIELADQIRQEFGQMQSEAFKQAVAPALEQALQALSQTRETISSAVATLAGGGAPNPMGGGMEEPGMDSGAMPPPEDMGGDEFAAADAAAGGSELAGRETREARQLFARKLSEAHSLVRSLSRSK